jgi:hypothetical protein
MGLVQLLVEHAEVRRFLPESDVRRRRQEGKRLGIRLPAENRSRIFLDHIWDDMYGQVKGLLAFGMNGVHRSQFAQEYRRAQEGRVAGRLRHLSRRDQRLLAIPRHHARGDEEDQDRGLPPARRGLRRKRRNLRQLGALAAMEMGRRAATRATPSSIRKFWRASS